MYRCTRYMVANCAVFLLVWCSCVGIATSDCSDPPLISNAYHNGSDTIATYHENDVIVYRCYGGYERRGYSRCVCQNGNWTRVEMVCNLVSCPDPRIDRLQLSYPLTAGSYVTASCSYGYRLVGPSRLMCMVDMEWRPPLPSCTVVTCPPLPTLTYGERYQDTFTHDRDTHGSVVENRCRSGFLLRGGSTQTCQGDGTWSGEPAVCPAGCSDPPLISNAYHNGSDTIATYRENDVIVYRCYGGYERRGYSRCVCQNGNWTRGEMVCNLVSCPDPRIDRLQLSYPRTAGSYVTASCSHGYRLVGPSRLLCMVNMEWRPSLPSCTVVTCPPLPSLMYGERYQDTFTHERDTHGSVVENTCRSGFLLRGGSTQTCQEDGTWGEEPAVCQEISCGIPDVGQGIMGSHDSIRLGDINFIYCFENVTYSGDDDTGLIRCTENGWTEGYCYANCILEEMDNRVILEARIIHHDEELPWRCPENYVKPLEIRDITCYNGTLTTRPSCQHVISNPGRSCLSPSSGDQAYLYGDTCYYLLRDDYGSKQDAVSVCHGRYSAQLVTVRHQNIWRFLQTVKRHAGWGSKDVWLGLRWGDGTWKWDNGEPVGRFSSTLWQEGEGGSTITGKWQKCANMEGDEDWRWHDVYCSSYMRFFSHMAVICEGSRSSVA